VVPLIVVVLAIVCRGPQDVTAPIAALPGHCVGIASASKLHRRMISLHETNIQILDGWRHYFAEPAQAAIYFKNKMYIDSALCRRREKIIVPRK
jgi:hypothetical protein